MITGHPTMISISWPVPICSFEPDLDAQRRPCPQCKGESWVMTSQPALLVTLTMAYSVSCVTYTCSACKFALQYVGRPHFVPSWGLSIVPIWVVVLHL